MISFQVSWTFGLSRNDCRPVFFHNCYLKPNFFGAQDPNSSSLLSHQPQLIPTFIYLSIGSTLGPMTESATPVYSSHLPEAHLSHFCLAWWPLSADALGEEDSSFLALS
jgi:hypothetical protein